MIFDSSNVCVLLRANIWYWTRFMGKAIGGFDLVRVKIPYWLCYLHFLLKWIRISFCYSVYTGSTIVAIISFSRESVIML